MPATATAPHRVGETKSFGGHTYRLNENSRWERQDQEQPGQKQPGAAADKTTAETPIGPNSGSDPAASHAFTKSQLGSVSEPLRGVFSALHAHPEVQSGGAVVTQAFAPEQASAVYQHLKQSATKPVGGAGQVGQAIDLGGGKMGYASPAGSIIIWPADSSGKHQIQYTNQTGVVKRAMGGQQPSSVAPGAGSTPPPVQPTPPPVPPPVIAKPPQAPLAQATPAQMASVTALMEKPVKSSVFRNPREEADEAAEIWKEAVRRWRDDADGGASPKINARWRSATAAMKSRAQHLEQLAKNWERKSKGGGKGSAKSQAGSGSTQTPLEAQAAKSAPEAFQELSAMREQLGEVAYWDAVQQLAGQRKPWLGRRLSEDEPRETAMPSPAEKHSELASERPDEQGTMNRLGLDPQTDKPRETKSQIEARLRREVLAGIAPEVPRQKQPPPIEGSDGWKRLVKSKASEWDMKPEDFHSLASDLHRELVEHHGQRKEAYLHARKSTGLAPADINRLENQGFDSGSKHKDIRQLDVIGRELAAQYPALGWGRGREGDDDEGGIDYGENLWALIRDGYQPPPGKHSPEFMEHVEEFLRSQLKSHGSSGVAGGHVAEGEDLSAVPFAKVRKGMVQRYRKYLLRYGQLGFNWDEQDHPRVPKGSPEGGEFAPLTDDHKQAFREIINAKLENKSSDILTANEDRLQSTPTKEAGEYQSPAQSTQAVKEPGMTESNVAEKTSYESVLEAAKAGNWKRKQVRETLYKANDPELWARRDEMMKELGFAETNQAEAAKQASQPQQPATPTKPRELSTTEKIAALKEEMFKTDGPAKVTKEKTRLYLTGIPRGSIAARRVANLNAHWDDEKQGWWMGRGDLSELSLLKIAAAANRGDFSEAETKEQAAKEFKAAQRQAEIGLTKNVTPHWPTWHKANAILDQLSEFFDAVKHGDVKDAQVFRGAEEKMHDLFDEAGVETDSSTADIWSSILKYRSVSPNQKKAIATAVAKQAAIKGVGKGDMIGESPRQTPVTAKPTALDVRADESAKIDSTPVHHVTLIGSKKTAEKPYLAKIGPGFSREFVDGKKHTNTSKRFEAELAAGDVVEWRGHSWESDEGAYVGGKAHAVMLDDGIAVVSPNTARQLVDLKTDGWQPYDQHENGDILLRKEGQVMQLPQKGEAGITNRRKGLDFADVGGLRVSPIHKGGSSADENEAGDEE